jgi:hypothetical protein
VPVRRATAHAEVAPAAVEPARTTMSRVRAVPSDASGPAWSSASGERSRGSRSAIASAGAMSVSRLTSSS